MDKLKLARYQMLMNEFEGHAEMFSTKSLSDLGPS